MFTFESVSKRYGAITAVDALSAQFSAGSVSALIGTSGSGKSTLLRLLLALEWPDSGRVLIEGEPLTPARRQRVRQRIGYVIQEGGLFPHLTALQNLSLLPQHLRWPRGRIQERAAQLLQLMQLPADILLRYPNELSGGQRQRVAIMRALMTDPPALLLDEPLGALDPLVRFDLQQNLRQLFAGLGKTVLLVTHDLPEAAYLAPRLLLMQNGTIVQDGTLADLLQRPANDFVRRFVGAQRTLTAVTDP